MNTIVENNAPASHEAAKYFTAMNFVKAIALLILCSVIYNKISQNYQESIDSQKYLNAPKIDDIYFLDYRKLSSQLRPNEKYRLAKVVDITGDIVTLLYGSMFFVEHKAAKDSIRYGQLRYKKYFEPKRYDLSPLELQAMYDDNAIYMIKRPEKNMLYGNYINNPKRPSKSTIYVPGKRENIEGLSFLAAEYLEDNLDRAFERFSVSADHGFAQGQVNLAQLYLNTQYAPQNLDKALFWFKQAALQSNKAGVLKYVIVCRKVSYCYESDFFQELTQAGVHIKVREIDVKLKTH